MYPGQATVTVSVASADPNHSDPIFSQIRNLSIESLGSRLQVLKYQEINFF